MKRYLHTAWRGLTLRAGLAVLWLILGSHALFFTACAAILYSVVLPIVVIVALILSKAAFENRFGFLRSITNSQERRRVADSIRRMASLDKALLVANPREAVIALFYTGVAALQDLALSLTRGETPEELVIWARQRSEPVASFLDLLVAAFYRARYSNQDVQPQQAITSRDAYRSLVAAVKTKIESKRASHSRVVTIK
jgi:hypothetical protein